MPEDRPRSEASNEHGRLACRSGRCGSRACVAGTAVRAYHSISRKHMPAEHSPRLPAVAFTVLLPTFACGGTFLRPMLLLGHRRATLEECYGRAAASFFIHTHGTLLVCLLHMGFVGVGGCCVRLHVPPFMASTSLCCAAAVADCTFALPLSLAFLCFVFSILSCLSYCTFIGFVCLYLVLELAYCTCVVCRVPKRTQ